MDHWEPELTGERKQEGEGGRRHGKGEKREPEEQSRRADL